MKTIINRQLLLLVAFVALMFVSSVPVSAQSTTAEEKTEQSPDSTFLLLPSGTIWYMSNEEGYYTYAEAKKKFKKHLPTKEQWQELIDSCDWKWTGNGYKVTDKFGRSMFLPATGYKSSYGNLLGEGIWAFYWAAEAQDSNTSWGIWMEHAKKGENKNVNNIHIYTSKQDYYQSVRLVK